MADEKTASALADALTALLEQTRPTFGDKSRSGLGALASPFEPRKMRLLSEALDGTTKRLKDFDKSVDKISKAIGRMKPPQQTVAEEMRRSNDAKRAQADGLGAGMASGALQPLLKDAALLEQRLDNLNSKKQLTGLTEALKSGKLQPLIKEAVELEQQAEEVEKALAWEKLKAEKGALGAYFTVGKEKVQAFGAAASKVFDGMSSGVKAAAGAFSGMQSGFQKMQSSFAQTIPLANPAAWIRMKMAMDDLNAVMGQILLPTFIKVTAAVRHLANFLISLPAPVKKAISTFALFGAAITAAGGAMVLLAPLVTAVTAGVSALVTVGSALAAVMGPAAAALAIPLAPLAAIAAALTAGVGIWAAYKTGVFEAMAGFAPLKPLAGTLTGIAKSLEGTFDGFIPVIAKVATLGIQGLEGIANAIKPVVNLASNLTKALMPLANYLLRLGGGAMQQVLGSVGKLSTAFEGMGNKLTAKLGPFIQSIMPAIGRIGAALSKAFEAMQPAIDSALQLGEELFDLFLDYGLPAITHSVNMVAKAIEMLAPTFKTAMSGVKLAFDTMKNLFNLLNKVIDDFVSRFKKVYDTIRDTLQKGGIEIPELKWGGVGAGDGPDFSAFDGKAEEMRKAFEDLKKLWDKPTNSSVGAAARPAQFNSIEEFGRQATLSAYGAAASKPEDKIIDKLADQQRQAHDDAQAIVAALASNAQATATAALRGF